MPLTPKEDAPGASGFSSARITAGAYNLHDQEIRSVEEFLGDRDAAIRVGLPRRSQDERGAFAGPSSEADLDSALFSTIAGLIDRANILVGPDGATSSSGVIHSGQRVVFPERAHATFLTAAPAATDRAIAVNSTTGFPDSGVVTIINATAGDSSGSTVEYVRYGRRTQTSFSDCIRGSFGTTVGSHALTAPIEGSVANDDDACLTPPPLPLELCWRRNPALRNLTWNEIPQLGLGGDLVAIKRDLRRSAAAFRIDPRQLDADFLLALTSVGNGLGIVKYRKDGTIFFESADSSFRALGQLTWAEASSLVDGLANADQVEEQRTPSSWAWPTGAVPVFAGKLSLQVFPLSYARPLPPENGRDLDALRVIVRPDGVVRLETPGIGSPLSAAIGFQTFFVGSLKSSAVRNDRGAN